MNALEKYNQLYKDFIVPYFAELGFRTPAANFYIDLGDFRKIVQFQKSQFNSGESMKFTINIGIFDKLATEGFSDKPWVKKVKSPRPCDCILEKRIGSLLPPNLDKWYKIDENTSIEDVKRELENDLSNYLLPYLNGFESLEDVVNAYITEDDLYITSRAPRIYYAYHQIRMGHREKAEPILNEYLAKWENHDYWPDKLKSLLQS